MKAILLALTCFLTACAAAPASGEAELIDRVGWRVLADEHGVGADAGVFVAITAAEYTALWRRLGFDAGPPDADTSEEVVVAFTLPYPEGCEFPFMSLEVDHIARTLAPRYGGNEPAVCGDDLIPYTVVVGVRRADVAGGVYNLRLPAIGAELGETTGATLEMPE